MKVFKSWLATSFVVSFVALIAYALHPADTEWHNLRFPLPVMREEYPSFYLADFAFAAFLAFSAYWLALARFGKITPSKLNIPGKLLGIALFAFAVVSLDFVFGLIPVTEHCSANTSSGISMTVCRYSHAPRYFLATVGGLSLIASGLFSVFKEAFFGNDADEVFE